eukprot:191443-Chlamydomonas_euryale.AAC.7
MQRTPLRTPAWSWLRVSVFRCGGSAAVPGGRLGSTLLKDFQQQYRFHDAASVVRTPLPARPTNSFGPLASGLRARRAEPGRRTPPPEPALRRGGGLSFSLLAGGGRTEATAKAAWQLPAAAAAVPAMPRRQPPRTRRRSGGFGTALFAALLSAWLAVGLLAAPAYAQGAAGLGAWCTYDSFAAAGTPPAAHAASATCAGSATPVPTWSSCQVCFRAPRQARGRERDRCDESSAEKRAGCEHRLPGIIYGSNCATPPCPLAPIYDGLPALEGPNRRLPAIR